MRRNYLSQWEEEKGAGAGGVDQYAMDEIDDLLYPEDNLNTR